MFQSDLKKEKIDLKKKIMIKLYIVRLWLLIDLIGDI